MLSADLSTSTIIQVQVNHGCRLLIYSVYCSLHVAVSFIRTGRSGAHNGDHTDDYTGILLSTWSYFWIFSIYRGQSKTRMRFVVICLHWIKRQGIGNNVSLNEQIQELNYSSVWLTAVVRSDSQWTKRRSLTGHCTPLHKIHPESKSKDDRQLKKAQVLWLPKMRVKFN